jgi:isocitrate dehydrogenase
MLRFLKQSTALRPILRDKEKPTRQPYCSGITWISSTGSCSSLMMLRHMSLNEHADRVEKAIFDTLAEGKSITGDLGGKASTSEYTKAIISRLK